MPRFRRALAGAAMAMAMAGGGLVATMAGAASAHAATTPTPAASHTFSFTTVPAAQAAGGIGPKFQCGDTCDPGGDRAPPPPPPTITCTISVNAPYQTDAGNIVVTSDTICTGAVAEIIMVQNVVHRPVATLSDFTDVPNKALAHINRTTPCAPAPDSWTANASATVVPPAGWVIIAGQNPIVASVPATYTFNHCNNSGGGGGGGGCATGTPSVPAQPAARLPMVVTC